MSVALISTIQLTVFRLTLGIVERYELPFFSVIMILIGGLMSGLTAMILHSRRNNSTTYQSETSQHDARVCRHLHLSGLCLYIGLPLANYFLVFWLWKKHKHTSKKIHDCAIEVLNFQITVYLYLLLALFLTFIAFGLILVPAILLCHFISTVIAAAYNKPAFHYLANIPIIQGRKY